MTVLFFGGLTVKLFGMGQNTHRFFTQVVCTQEKFIPSKKLKASRATISGFRFIGWAKLVIKAPSIPFPVTWRR